MLMTRLTKEELADFIGPLTKSGNFYTRYEATKALGKLACDESADSLVSIMSDTELDIDLRIEAIGSLSRFANKEHVNHFVKLLEDFSAEIRTDAIKALEKIGDPAATDSIIKAMKYQGDELYYEEEMEWDPMWDIQLEAVTALGKIGNEKAVKAIIEYYEDDDSQEISETVFTALARIGSKEALNFLSKILDDGAPEERRRVAETLTKHPHESFKSKLVKVLMDKDVALKVGAAKALAALTGLKDDTAVTIAMLLRDEKDWVRAEIVKLLSPSGMDDLEDHVVTLLNDPSTQVRAAAAEGLKYFSAENVAQKLFTLLKEDKEEDVKLNAASSLAALKMPELAQTLAEYAGDVSKSPYFRIHCIHLIKDNYPDTIVELLLAHLETEPRQVSVAAAYTLASTKAPEIIKNFIAILERAIEEEPEEEIKEKAAKDESENEGAQETEGEAEGEGCGSAVKDEEYDGEYIRVGKKLAIKNPGFAEGSCAPEEVAAMLADVDTPEVKEILIKCLESDHEALAAAAAESLGKLKVKDASEKLLNSLQDNSPELRMSAAQALGEIGDVRVIDKLGDILADDTDPTVREKAALALGMIGAEEGLEQLKKGLKGDDALVAKTCLVSIGKIGGAQAAEPLLEVMFDYENFNQIRQDICAALRKVDNTEAANTLMEILRSEERDADHWAAVQALGEIFR